MKKFNRVLYAVISDMFEKLIISDPDISNDDIMQKMYQEFDETAQLVFDDLDNVAQITDIATVNIDGDKYSKEEMVDMLVNGITFNSKNVRTEVRSLVRHLNGSLDESFVIYPMIIDGHEGDIAIERKLRVEANISIGENKIYLLKGDGDTPDIELFKIVYPEILKWINIEKQKIDDKPPSNPKERDKSQNRFDYL